MNKLVVVLSAAAAVTLAGCRDPNFRKSTTSPEQDAPKSIETVPEAAPVAPPPAVTPVQAEPVITVLPPEPVPVVKPEPVEPVYTTYVVQSGDYLAKISKKFNVRIDALRAANPNVKNDKIMVGQSLKIPGKVDVGVQEKPAPVAAPKATGKVKTYDGPTKEYVVKSGDQLGKIAYANGISVRALKALNNLTSDNLRVGQKLKVPAEKQVAAKPVAKTVAKPKAEAEKKAVAVEEKAPTAEKAVEQKAATEPVVEPAAEAVPAEKKADAPVEAVAPATSTYVVQDGDDMTSVSIQFGVSPAVIRELNNLPADAQLKPGDVVKLPADSAQ